MLVCREITSPKLVHKRSWPEEKKCFYYLCFHFSLMWAHNTADDF